MAATKVPDLELDIQLPDGERLPAGADFPTWIRAAIQGAAGDGVADGMGGGALSVRVVGLAEGADLNSTWRLKAGPTNVLAFPGPQQ
ncbi:MAG: hypothetical protein ABIX37_01015, partial [Gammaproteobacteria bacterium]